MRDDHERSWRTLWRRRGGDHVIFRTKVAAVLGYGLPVMSLVILGWSLVDGGWSAVQLTAPFAISIGAVGWLLFGGPRAVVHTEGVTLVNVLRTVEVPWSALEATEARHSLLVFTRDGKRYSAWAVPAASGTMSRLRAGRSLRAGASTLADSAAEGNSAEAAVLTIGEWQQTHRKAAQRKQAAEVTAGGPGVPHLAWNSRELLIVLATATIIALGVLL
ncbi:PH domain-containing protein [Bogoriella caseilytica]|uniref:PH (Pleckstrin Homology) domain-containing protein n=1 Tax=Bogoriella caseilytica TaxID=56055 RepID=A0A3N2BBD7_9MICO|nr:PH domain-containing protein [Bogoriella caseilytica]ROR72573.1 PH (Pleckstrin Homology) domain-containing protein [Bogoriella caseilytica]